VRTILNIEFNSNINEVIAKIPIGLKLKENVLEDIAEIVRKKQENNIQSGVHFNTGSALQPNKKGTQLFNRTGQLFQSVKKRQLGEDWEVYISDNRKDIAKYQQTGSYKGGTPREFFGLGQQLKNDVRKYFSNHSFNYIYNLVK
jgi:hypothetical protein